MEPGTFGGFNKWGIFDPRMRMNSRDWLLYVLGGSLRSTAASISNQRALSRHPTKRGPGRMPPSRHKQNPPGTKLYQATSLYHVERAGE